MNTGKRSANYHLYSIIYDEDKKELDSDLRDNFFGSWAKCEVVIRQWRKQYEKLGLKPLPLDIQ